MQSLSFLTKEQLYRSAPSVFGESGSTRTSERYCHIPTINIVEGLEKEGFKPVRAMQTRTMSAERRNYSKHILRFRHVDTQQDKETGLYPEIVLVNSHDGLSSYRLMAGAFRVVCLNGLIAGDTYKQIRVRHQGDILHDVIEGTYEVIKDAQKMVEVSAEMQTIELNPEEKKIFADAAHLIRYEGKENGAGIDANGFLRPRRREEVNKNDLFTTFNIVQENIIRGGIYGYTTNANGHRRRMTTRAVNSIDTDTNLNRALWTLTEKMAELKNI